MATWPSTLPYPQLAGNGSQAGVTSNRTDFDSGPARQRQIYTSAPHRKSHRWKLNATQMATFVNFYENDIGYGSNWFTFEADLGFGLQSVEARFVGPYSDPLIRKGFYLVSADMEVRAP